MPRRLAGLAALLVLITASPALGDDFDLEALHPRFDGWMSYFGQDVDVDPVTGTVVAGAYGQNPNHAGGAWVIEWDGDRWAYTLLQPKPTPHPARAGSAVAIERDLIAVGAPFDGRVASQGGAVYLFRRVDEGWTLETVLAPDDLEPNDWFGFYLDLNEGRVAVGATNDDSAEGPGKVYVFERHHGVWQYERLDPEGGEANDWFGSSIHLDGDVLAVGATGVDGEAENQGAVYLYHHDGTAWSLEERIDPIAPFGALYFGVRIHGDGERIAITAAGAFDHAGTMGRIYLLTPAERRWVQTVAYEAEPSHANLGTSIVIDGGTIYVGSLGGYNYQQQPGRVLVLTEGGDGEWSVADTWVGPGNQVTEYGFGWSMAGSADTLVVGAPGYRGEGELSGEMFARVAPRCQGHIATLFGTPQADVIVATTEPDVILAGSGSDRIEGVAADDIVCTGRGYDTVIGPAESVLDPTWRDRLVVAGTMASGPYVSD